MKSIPVLADGAQSFSALLKFVPFHCELCISITRFEVSVKNVVIVGVVEGLCIKLGWLPVVCAVPSFVLVKMGATTITIIFEFYICTIRHTKLDFCLSDSR